MPELLAPAGDWECAKAAVENGADAIYFGLEQFNARMRARNFTQADLPKLMEFLHRRGVRGYVTFNTLLFPEELEQAEGYLRAIIAAGVDAAIVQDVGACRLIRAISPDFPIHASTQMTVTSAVGVEFARQLGCQLVVLARECSIAEIEKIRAAGASAAEASASLPLEVFVHGALCVAYSGQCLTSESLGGRSANRGECAQACRMTYDLLSDGQVVPLGDRRYLLSPQDLAGLDVLPELVRAGVSSLKIEGRLKAPEYVANITRVYRQALDRLAATGAIAVPPQDRYEMEMAFSRGLFTGWFRGIDNQELVHARFGKKRGVLIGRVRKVGDRQILIAREGSVKAGDGVVFDHGKPDEPEQGGRVYTVVERGQELALTFGPDAVEFARVHPGDRVWKTSDPELERHWKQSFAGNQPRFQRPLVMEVHGALGTPLTLIARDEEGHAAQAESTILLEAARTQPLSEARLREQLGRLGGTPFRLERLENHLPDGLVLPVSELNRLRREAVRELDERRAAPKRWQMSETPAVARCLPESPGSSSPGEPELIPLVRTMEQLAVAIECGARTIYCEFENPKRYRDAVSLVRCADCRGPAPSVWIAPPRIFKTGEEWILQQVLSAGADGCLARNYDHLAFFKDHPRRGDFSLNVSNAIAGRHFIERCGLDRVTASYDLNAAQLEALLRSAPPGWFEVTLHQHIPMFHMEHCVFCAFLSTGKDYRDCGRPCDTHHVQLRDRVGAVHPLKADAGCRNTVFNARAQTGAEFFERFRAAGARHFRVEFLNESADETRRTLAHYRKLLRGETTGAQLWRELKLLNQLGVTRGQLAGERAEPTSR